jgi:tetratricopeptide (TPR) repeat protein
MHQLWSRNLVDYDSPIESYTLHPLVREFATTQQREAEAGVFRRYAKYYAQIATDIESLYLQGGDQMLEGLDIFDQERSHIEASWIWAKAQGEDTLLLQFLCIVGHTGLVRYHIRHEYIPRAEETLAAARRLKRRGDECHLLNVLGSAYRSLGDLPTAISYYKKALELLRTVRKQSNEVSVLGNLGNAYLNLGDRKQATKHYKRSLNTARKRQDVRGESAALGQLGLAHAESGEYDHAIALYEQSLTIARQHRYRDYEEEILTGLGTVYLEQGELENARAVCEGALHIIQETGNRRDEGYAYLLLGKITAAEQSEQPEQAEQSPPQAEDHYHTALTIAREIGDKRMEGRVLQANGALALTQQQGAYAQSLLEEALAIAQATGDRRGEAMSSWQLGVLLQQQTPAALEQAVELMQVRVAYEQAIDHPAAADHQQQVAAVRQAAITRGQ